MESSYGHSQLFLEILLVCRGGFFGAMGVVGNSVEFDDCPAAEIDSAQRFEDGGDVHESVPKPDETIGMLRVLASLEALDVFNVQEEQAIAEFLDGFRGVAAALKMVRDVQFQFDVARIRKAHNLIEFFGALAQRAHVIVIAERDSEIRGALAEFGESLAKLFEVWRSRGTAFRSIVDFLEGESARVAQKLGVRRVLGDAFFRHAGVAEQIAAGKRHELQVALAKWIAQRGGA